MQKISIISAIALFMLSLTMSGCATQNGTTASYNMGTTTPFVYDTWNGFYVSKNGMIPVRLKAYCKPDRRWYLNAVSNPVNGKPILTQTATAYLQSLNVPTGTCTPNQSIGSAIWYPQIDKIIVDY